MKRILFIALTFLVSQTVFANLNTSKSVIDSSAPKFTEGILFTRVSFPGNVMNEALMKIDFEKGNSKEQLQQLQSSTNNEAYAKKMQESMESMSPEEKAAMGSMMMAAMMSPLYAKIYISGNEVLAKANAINYRLESYMNAGTGIGRMVAVSNDESQNASIRFTSNNIKKVWEKTEVSPEQYTFQVLTEKGSVAGHSCKKAVYTLKNSTNQASSPFQASPAYKLIVWYSDDFSAAINFLHPFYFHLDKGILKIEVHYDKKGKNKMLYEVTGSKPQKLNAQNFQLSSVEPVIDYDTEPMKASMNMLAVFMSQPGSAE